MSSVVKQTHSQALAISGDEMMAVLKSSLYPGASDDSIKLVIGYCKAAGLDPMQKPVHIVPMWDRNLGAMRDVIMPGVGLYRTQAARSGEYAGVTEPEFGEDVTEDIGGVTITYPKTCRVTVKRKLQGGGIADFAAVERWKENYAVKGGKEKSIAPNAMWMKRPYGQLAKCAQAQALRMAFPEIGAQPTADEMEGKAIDDEVVINGETGEIIGKAGVQQPQSKSKPPADKPEPQKTDAGKDHPASEGQINFIRTKLEAVALSEGDLLKKLNVATLDGLTVAQGNAALDWIKNPDA